MSSNFDKKKLGRFGESFVERYLNNKEYKTVEKNSFIGGGEIDLIVLKNSTYVFVEVKTREVDRDYSLLDTISVKKRKSLIKASESWLLRNNKVDVLWRIDFVGVLTRSGNVIKIEHIENAIF